MNKYSTIILLLFCSLLFTGIAEARLTLGVVGDDDRIRPLADHLAQQLGEEVEVKPLADTETLLNWLERFAMLDLAVLPSAEVAARPGRHLVLGKIGANGEMSLITAQGGGGDLPQRLGAVLKESGANLWGTQVIADKEPTKPRTIKAATPPAVTEDSVMKVPEVVHLPALRPGKAWVTQSDVTTHDILSTDALPTDKLVLGVVLEPGGPVQTAEQAERLAGYLQSVMQIPVTVRVFTQAENLTEWFNRYRMVDLAILRTETAASALEKNYRPLTGMFRATTDLFSLAVARLDLGEAVFNPLQAALVDMAAQEEGRKLLAEMGVISVQPPGVLPGTVTAPEDTVVVAAPALTSPPAPRDQEPPSPRIESAPPAVPVVEVLPPEQAEAPAPPAPVPPRELEILLTTPVVTGPGAPAPPANLERPLAALPKVAEATPAIAPGPLKQEIVLPVITTLPTVAQADKVPIAPELPSLPEIPAASEQEEIPETAPAVTIATEKPVAAAVAEEPVVAAVVTPVEPPTAPVSPPVEPTRSESLPAPATTPPPVTEQEELQRIVEELLPRESEAVALTDEPVTEFTKPQAPPANEDITSMLGENPVVAMVSQPEIPEGLRPPGIPVLRPGRIQKRATAEEDKRLLQEMPQPLKKTYVQPPPSLLPEAEPEPGVIYVIPFVSVMVPQEVDGRIFDQFVDILNQQGASLELRFVILKEGLQRVDPDWLAARKYVTGEIYAYVEDSGCCSTDLRTKARLTYRRPRQTDPAFGFEYPTKRFFDHDLSTLAKERLALADNIAQVLASELLSALKN